MNRWSIDVRLNVLVLLVIVGCNAPPWEPQPPDRIAFLERAQTQVEGGLRVTAAVPSAEETRDLFGVALYRRGIQPVWLEVENGRDDSVTFLPAGLDPGYFTPLETAALNDDQAKEGDVLWRFFFDSGMAFNVEPGATRTGYVFTRTDEGTKTFNVDVVGPAGGYWQFTFFIPVPGLRLDHSRVDWDALYTEDEVEDVDRAGLAAALAELPTFASNKKGTGRADPMNLVVIGDLDDVYHAFVRAGWDETEVIYRGSLWKTVKSFFSGGEYRYSPVSSLYSFGRSQDIALQKTRENIHERNHLRLWLAPLRCEGKDVFVGQISRDIGVRFYWRSLTTHKIDPDIDETREFLVEDLAYAQGLARLGYVAGIPESTILNPDKNLTGDPFFTDGRRVVMWVSSRPVDIADLELVDL